MAGNRHNHEEKLFVVLQPFFTGSCSRELESIGPSVFSSRPVSSNEGSDVGSSAGSLAGSEDGSLLGSDDAGS
jgi:hypothetical protein